MQPNEYQPGERAPASGQYEELNVFGSQTGQVVVVLADEDFPPAPRGFTWRRLTERPPAELLAQAATYRGMAANAATAEVKAALEEIARRHEALAEQRTRDRQDTP